MNVENYPKEWKTNKNLRYWLSQQKEEFVFCEDDISIHEAIAVKFAKQYNQKEIDKLQEENRKLSMLVATLKDCYSCKHDANCDFTSEIYKTCVGYSNWEIK